MSGKANQSVDPEKILAQIRSWAHELGFQGVGISDVDLADDEKYLHAWLKSGYQAEMDYMSKHGTKRSRPDDLIPTTKRVISVRMDYLPSRIGSLEESLNNRSQANIALYARGRDYHKLVRKRLQQLAEKIEAMVGNFGYRVFVDSAPVLERAIAQKAGLGWIGKNTMLINKRAGSWFFLGEIYTDLDLPLDKTDADKTSTNHCGTCQKCISVCPTDAIVAPYQLDARKCISYLTIEHRGSIPVEFRKAIGNRIFGCDDCNWICPWNKFAQLTKEKDFLPRHGLDGATLAELFLWDEDTFLKNTEGSAIRRTGYENWLRNIAVALGNAENTDDNLNALKARADHSSELVREHVVWALAQRSAR